VREHPEDIVARLFLADAYVKRRENQLAIQQYELVLKKEPKNVMRPATWPPCTERKRTREPWNTLNAATS
jgi:hypothetical protein